MSSSLPPLPDCLTQLTAARKTRLIIIRDARLTLSSFVGTCLISMGLLHSKDTRGPRSRQTEILSPTINLRGEFLCQVGGWQLENLFGQKPLVPESLQLFKLSEGIAHRGTASQR